MKIEKFDVCVIGSGAGGGPVAYELSHAGYETVVLEKGPWFHSDDFYKDELACCLRDAYTPDLNDEQHVLEELNNQQWQATATSESGWNFWNGNCVGGSSNFMSGFFHRMKPKDFRLLSEFGKISGANIVDWPISYDDLEPYFTKVEKLVGVSGRVLQHPHLEPRSTADFPYPPTAEHPISQWIDTACQSLDYHPFPVARAILSKADNGRNSCEYSGYCGSFGCASNAKGSSRAALLNSAIKTGHCYIKPHSKVVRLLTDAQGEVRSVVYVNNEGLTRKIEAKIFVVACQAIESTRLLLLSSGEKHPDGIGNRYQQLGKNLIFSGGGSGRGDFRFADLDEQKALQLRTMGPFVNRALHDWYYIDEQPGFTQQKLKGGMIEFLLQHPNPTSKGTALRWDNHGDLLWGKALKRKMELWFRTDRSLDFEVFNDWLPTDNCFVTLDNKVTDKWGSPVAKVRIGYHEHDLKVGEFLSQKAITVLKKMGAKNINSSISGSPPPNLVAGGCRFGSDPKTSVLDADCRVHDAGNLFVTDASFMPTGGSVPYTWTIYANSFRVADKIKEQIS